MAKVKIFDNITENEREKMLNCFRSRHKKYHAGAYLAPPSDGRPYLGILLSGEADLMRLDYDGYRNIIEHLSVGDVFGDIFATQAGNDELTVVAESDCEVLFADYRDVLKRCPNACKFHSVLVENLLRITLETVQNLRNHLDVLSRRTLRTKLLTYFRMQAKQAGGNTFTLPFTLADLADYLYVDRSAMLREMKNLREENLLSSRGRKITLK